VAFDSYVEVQEETPFEEIMSQGFNPSESEMVQSLMDADQDKIDEGKLVSDAINQNLSTFNPDMLIEQMVKNFALAKNMYGESILRRLSGFDASYINKNISIPEFLRDLKAKITEKIEKLKEDKLIDEDGGITERGYDLAALVNYMEELEHLVPKGILGEKIHKKAFVYGDKSDERGYKKGDRFKDISLKKSVRSAIKKKHSSLEKGDLIVSERKSRGQLYVVYALDASGSMKGKKIEICKKAGIALAYKAINEKDKVGLLAFGTNIKEKVRPTDDFAGIVRSIVKVRASMQTNIAETIRQSIDMFPSSKVTKHIILLTDALPTYGDKPEEETLEAVSAARSNGITISLIGIGLDDNGRDFAKKVAEIGEGKFYVVRDVNDIDQIVLEDYYGLI